MAREVRSGEERISREKKKKWQSRYETWITGWKPTPMTAGQRNTSVRGDI